MKRRWNIVWASLTLLCLAGGGLVMLSSRVCDTQPEINLLVGSACTAQFISIPATTIITETIAILPLQKLFLLIVPLSFLVLDLFPKATDIGMGLTWFNKRLNFSRAGPSPQNQFLPYLYPTHDW